MKRRKLSARGPAHDDGEVEVVKMVNRKLGVVIQRREESGARRESDQGGPEVERIQYRWVIAEDDVYYDDDVSSCCSVTGRAGCPLSSPILSPVPG